ncbi:helix-turn-helix domain-containing protein [Sphingomonas sp. 3-13AW]|uniref:helix-turn-helix domain-containing protein n=1 Tax=Sphingomonas sp. 3-13AW TaxID=3050450 RepID=UPI003BB657AB
MSIRIMSAVWALPLADSEKLVLLALADCANDDGVCWPSIAALVRKCSKSDRTIQAAIKSLAAAGHLSRLERPGKGVLYTIHPTPEAASPPKRLPPETVAPTPEAASDKPSRTPITSSDASHPTRRTHPAPAGKPGSAGSADGQSAAPVAKRRWPKDMPPPAGVTEDQWAGYIDHRKAKRNTLTPRAYELLVDKLDKHATADWPPGRIVDLMVERGWLSFELPWLTNATENRNAQRPHHERPSGAIESRRRFREQHQLEPVGSDLDG